MINWHLEVLPIKDLKDHPKNPRQISKEQMKHLEGLIKKFGLIDKPIVNKDWTIIGGHQRIKVLKRMKTKNVECWVPDRQLEDSEINELCVRLNLNQGQWDFDILANQWEVTDLLQWGFSEEMLFELGKDVEEVVSLDEEEAEVEAGKDEDAKTKLGDLYELGDHRLICGDSTLPETVEKVMGGFEPILMVTDPPYGVNYDPLWRNEQNKKNGSPTKMIGKVLNDDKSDWTLSYVLFKGSVAYVWHGGKLSISVAKNLQDAGFDVIYQIIWNKQKFAFGRGDYHWKHEPCWYVVRSGHNHNWKGDRKQTTIWDIASLNSFGASKDEDDKKEGHGTQKPIECMARPIQNHTDKGDWVYDPFLGSGTTLIAAERLKRKCIGIELSPAYCDVIVKRYANAIRKKGQEPIILRNGDPCANEF